MASTVLVNISRDEVERARLLSEYKYKMDIQSKLVTAERPSQAGKRGGMRVVVYPCPNVYTKTMKKLCGFLLFWGVLCTVTGAQEILTAGKYLEQVSERYSSIKDYQAAIAIRAGNTFMNGLVSHIGPNLLRIDFFTPPEQILVFNGEALSIYLPNDEAILNQNINARDAAPNLATARGLSLLRNNYTAAFVVGPNPVPLEDGSSERVIKLRLARRSASESFREIILDVDPETMLIRRVTGRSNSTQVRFDFSSIKINQGIPEKLFVFDAPPASNVYNNFLFKNAE